MDLKLTAALLLLAGPVFAQGNPAVNELGAVQAFDASSITVKTDDGAVDRFALAPTLLVVQAKPATLADIKPGDFVASAARRGRDGKLHSTELRIFPPAMRGLGEGQRLMNDPESQTMTNATVTGAAVVAGSNDVEVRFEGGRSELILDPGVPVTRLDTTDRSAVITGAKARVQGTRTSDGVTITRITLQ